MRNFYRDAWAHDLMEKEGLPHDEAYWYVDERMEEYYQEKIKNQRE